MAKRRIRAQSERTGPGRPSVHQEAWSKVSVVLFDRQVLRLDRLAAGIRRRAGVGTVNRTVIIRALIDGFLASKCDVRTSRTEADLRRCITDTLRHGVSKMHN
jgi:hypothetical protein